MQRGGPRSSPWTDLERPPLREAVLRRALVDHPSGGTWRALQVVARTGSTNADLIEAARGGEPEGLVLVAEEQQAGRGRLGREWTAPMRSALAVSVLLRPGEADPDGRPPVPAPRWSWLALLAGVAAVDALRGPCELPAVLKWPNDVLVPFLPAGDERGLGKVGGVLAEVAAEPGRPAVVVGAGINVSQDADELPTSQATSLRLAGAAVTDRDTVLRAYLRALSTRYRDWRAATGDPVAGGLAAAYREMCVTVGQRVRVELPSGEELSGLADGVDDEGRLLVSVDGAGRTAVAAGDVVHVRPGG